VTVTRLGATAATLISSAAVLIGAAASLRTDSAAAQAPPAAPCQLGGKAPTIASPAGFAVPAVNNNQNFDCVAWQAFITLNWPAVQGQPGTPDPSKQLGDPGTPVWQTFATVDQIFPSNGARPIVATPSSVGAGRLALASSVGIARSPGPRLLRQKSKLSPAIRRAPTLARAAASPLMNRRRIGLSAAPSGLNEDTQADGNVLIDQNGNYAYYEELLNPVEATYIVNNGLYSAATQKIFATRQPIAMPPGSVEVKAAWKILGPGDDPTHFITAQAFIDGGTTPTTVGLVGMHMILRFGTLYQGVWATFQQIENAPPDVTAAHYSFNNPQCSATKCPPNAVTAKPTPTQVKQIFPIERDAATVNSYVAALLRTRPQASAFGYYRLINVQWPNSSSPLPPAPQAAPLSTGSPNTSTLINPVLETFLQRSGTSCLGCHASATIAGGNLAANYSFLLVHAQGSGSAATGKRGSR
jgi:hypothetical protein